MKKLLSFILLTFITLTSCVSRTITHETGFDSNTYDIYTDIDDVVENPPVSDTFPIKSLNISGNDIGLYTVVYPKNATDTVKYAADEFVSYVYASTGVHIKCTTDNDSDNEYRIHIGKTQSLPNKIVQKLTRMDEEGYYLLCLDGNLYITGNGDRGTLYGVYSFLEKYVGVRYYTPDCERIIKADNVDIPGDLDTHFVPKFDFRDCFWYEAFDAEFSAKQKINSCISRDLKTFGGGASYDVNTVHTISSLAKTSDIIPCLTDDGIYNTVLESVKKWLTDNPEETVISLSFGEENYKPCNCQKCNDINKKEGTPIGSYITFINEIANDVKEEHPNVFVDTLIPGTDPKAPKFSIPADNVIIRLSTADACFSHAVNECTANTVDEYVTAWGKICKNLYVWDYTTNFMFYLCPFPNLYTIYDNIKFYAKNNVKGVFEQGNYNCASGEFGELRAYLLSKLMWDPEMTKEEYRAYMCDFLEGYYGEGWEYILEYIDKTSEEASNSHMLVYTGVKTVMGNKKSDSELAAFAIELSNLWKKAYNSTTETVCRRHVEKSKTQIDYYMMYIAWDSEKHPETLENMYNTLEKYNITHFREGTRVPILESFNESPSKW